MRNTVFFWCLLLGFRLVTAQNDTIQLGEVNLSDQSLLRFSETQSKTFLSDSLIQRNNASLGSLLQFNSLLYIKENGAGMVASPSFRGTTASQTAVIWNGININSSFLGQTDFNAVNTLSADHIMIKPGGGSMAYGSGAIGGSIHLNNEIVFNKSWENRVALNYGSYNAYGFNFRSGYSDEKFSMDLNFARNGSDNDFEIQNSDAKNRNGQFYNQNISLTAAYKFDPKNILKIYSNLYDGRRNFSTISPNAISTKYEDYNTRTLIEWNSSLGKFTSNLKLVHLGEEFRFYPTLQSKNPELGDADTWIVKYDLGWELKNAYLNTLLEFNQTEAEGSKISSAKRQIGSASLLWKHQLFPKLMYQASLRKEFSEVYQAPLLFSFGTKWDATKFYQILFNASKNFRMPTFNDLYWPGSGNPNLLPETSWQAELGNKFQFKKVRFDITAYYNSIENLIQWVPMGSISVPQNVYNVRIYGMESQLNYTKNWTRNKIDFNAAYAYTVSENEETGNQLIYVPFHKTTASVGYSWKFFSAYYQFLYNGKVFTNAQNDTELNGYSLSNFGLEWVIRKNRDIKIGGQILNLWNTSYQNVENRPMPGRNFNLYLHLKF